MINKFNYSCAKILGATVPDGFISGLLKFPKGLSRLTDACAYQLNQMRFHESYDWAYLLMHECQKRGLLVQAHAQIGKNAMMEHCFTGSKDKPDQPTVASPLEISTACLEVLNAS